MAFEVSLDQFRLMAGQGKLSDDGYWIMRREQYADPVDGRTKTVVVLYLYRKDRDGHLVFAKVPLMDVPRMYFPDFEEVEDPVELARVLEIAFQRFAREYMSGLVEAKRFVGIG